MAQLMELKMNKCRRCLSSSCYQDIYSRQWMSAGILSLPLLLLGEDERH
jgi:hypothetical protein